MKGLIFRKIIQPLAKIYWRVFKPKTYGSRAIIYHENSILLIKNPSAPHWSLPGGHIEKNESPEGCILRELKEELDISSAEIEFKLGEYVSTREGKRDTVFIFVIKLLSPNFEKQWEIDDAKFFRFEDLPKHISPATYRRVREYQEGKKGIISDW